MKEPVDKFLKDLKAPAPNAEARLRAKRTALAEFERAQAANDIKLPAEPRPTLLQALWNLIRPRPVDHSHGSSTMKWYMTRGFQAVAGGLAVVAIGLSWVLPNLGRYETELTQAVPKLPERAAQAESPTQPPEAQVGALTANPAPESARDAVKFAEDAQIANRQAEVDTRRRADLESKAQGNERSAPEPMVPDSAAPEPEVPSPPPSAPEVVRAPQLASASAPAPVAGVDKSMNDQRMTAGAAQPAAKELEQEELLESVVTTGARRSRSNGSPKNSAMARGNGPGLLESKGNTGDGTMAGIIATPAPESRDRFEHFEVNPVKQVAQEPVSTFSADVDTASYSFVRRQLNSGALPEKDAVRTEEMVNYFDYSWPAATSREQPFKPTVVVTDSPWAKGRKLVHIGIKGYELPARERPDANLVLLIDVSGSMNSPDKLPLVKDSIRMMVGHLKPADTVAMVVYAGAAGLVLTPTPVSEKQEILDALDKLQAGGSTAGAEGIKLAYEVAERSFRKNGVNRIILATDGDFNVGIDSTQALKGFVERKREKGVFLSVLGFGQGNYRDELAQALAQNGNGVAAYIDTLQEAQKVLVQEAGASLFTIAKDVKLQVEFNPSTVSEYRLVGYETRALKREDFSNDAVDAGDVGSGHTVTAIYEITPVGVPGSVDPSRYAAKEDAPKPGTANEYGFLRIRYKLPESRVSKLIEQPILKTSTSERADIARDVQFSTAVAGFAQLLRGGTYTGSLSLDDVIKQALAARGEDEFGYRNEFVQLVRRAQTARGM